ncbi:MFS transporter [Pseudonocardiaceae bacterium YIM PH 21723]|nr:MFS transporter [Pseudonocardiaceae bacterium YIM PH 21723]
MTRTLTGAGLTVLLLATLLPMMDSFIVNVALPTIADDLRTDGGDLELVVAGYVLAFTAFLVLGGRLGDTYGRRRVLLLGLAGFTVASALCAFAVSGPWLVAARVLQGATAALIPPQVLGTISAATPEDRRPRAMSLYTAVAGLAAVLGLVLGGLLVHADLWGTSWRLIFLVNLPLGLLALALVPVLIPDTRSTNPAGIDLPGTALLTLGITALLLALNRGPVAGWPWWTIALLIAVPILVILLWRTEKRAATPLLPPTVLTEPTVRGGLLLVAPFLAAWAGYLFALPLTLQHGFGLDPLQAGLLVAPMPLTFLAGSFALPALRRRLGNGVLGAGALVQAVGVAALLAAVLAGTPVWTVLPCLVLIGLGQALVIGSSQIAILGAVPTAYAGVGGGVLITTQQGSMAIGVAGIGSVYLAFVGLGHAGAFAVVLGIQLVVALLVAGAGRRVLG